MKRGGGVHTIPAVGREGWWNNVKDGKTLSRHRTMEGAAAAGRQMAKEMEVEHTVHREDDVIGEKNSYGNDPCPAKDGPTTTSNEEGAW